MRQADADWQQRYEWLTSVLGVGRVVANTLLALLPELGQFSHKRLVSLVAIAPFIALCKRIKYSVLSGGTA